jgi:hypothetical protein
MRASAGTGARQIGFHPLDRQARLLDVGRRLPQLNRGCPSLPFSLSASCVNLRERRGSGLATADFPLEGEGLRRWERIV